MNAKSAAQFENERRLKAIREIAANIAAGVAILEAMPHFEVGGSLPASQVRWFCERLEADLKRIIGRTLVLEN